jgi:hypothetical protein
MDAPMRAAEEVREWRQQGCVIRARMFVVRLVVVPKVFEQPPATEEAASRPRLVHLAVECRPNHGMCHEHTQPGQPSRQGEKAERTPQGQASE